MVILNKLVVVAVGPFAKKLENLMFSDIVGIRQSSSKCPAGLEKSHRNTFVDTMVVFTTVAIMGTVGIVVLTSTMGPFSLRGLWSSWHLGNHGH